MKLMPIVHENRGEVEYLTDILLLKLQLTKAVLNIKAALPKSQGRDTRLP
jgi:hypothetical protein